LYNFDCFGERKGKGDAEMETGIGNVESVELGERRGGKGN
jgi:hypothetical protein